MLCSSSSLSDCQSVLVLEMSWRVSTHLSSVDRASLSGVSAHVHEPQSRVMSNVSLKPTGIIGLKVGAASYRSWAIWLQFRNRHSNEYLATGRCRSKTSPL